MLSLLIMIVWYHTTDHSGKLIKPLWQFVLENRLFAALTVVALFSAGFAQLPYAHALFTGGQEAVFDMGERAKVLGVFCPLGMYFDVFMATTFTFLGVGRGLVWANKKMSNL